MSEPPKFQAVFVYEYIAESFVISGIFSRRADALQWIEVCDQNPRYAPGAGSIQELYMDQIITLLVKDRLMGVADLLEPIIRQAGDRE